MGKRRRGRAWPLPWRQRSPSEIAGDQWAALLEPAAIEPDSEDGSAAVAKVKEVISSLPVTLDDRLVTEARPRPAEIRDPLANEAIPAALQLAEYLANIDDESLDAILEAGLDAAVEREGMSVGGRGSRAHTLVSFASNLRFLLPAMVHAEAAARALVKDGRPAVPRREAECVVIELATIWAEHAEAEPDAFHEFVSRFFALFGIRPPSRKQYGSALAVVGDMTALSFDELAEVRRSHREERRRLVAECSKRWHQVRLMIRSDAEQAWNAAKAMGWPVDGEAAAWRAQARAVRERDGKA